MNHRPLEVLEKFWGYPAFRPLQEEIIQSVIDQRDTLALLPTGGGKSICFQVPAMCMDGICIVVSPLIALMRDQVAQLTRRGIKAVAIYSGMNHREIDILLDNCRFGDVKFLYVSPERLKTELFLERAKAMQISLLAIDEAHCISQWGYDFRPPYLEIAEFRKIIDPVPVIALTATATPEVRTDIIGKLELKNANTFVKSFSRKNLSYSVRKTEIKEEKILEVLKNVPGSGIVYARTRKNTENLSRWLIKNGIKADFYHAGLTNEERSAKQEAWINNKIRIMVATNAFGMGIDKADVRVVIHHDVPDNPEAYYQEAGRAGRDEKNAFAVLLYHPNDIPSLRKNLEENHPEISYLKQVYQHLANYFKLAVGSGALASFDFNLPDFIKTYQLDAYKTFQSLKKLEEEGFIQMDEAFYTPSVFMFARDMTEVYKFQVANAYFDFLLKQLLRTYGGEAFSDFVRLHLERVSKELKIDKGEVIRQLKLLAQHEIIFFEQAKDQPQITFLTERKDAISLPLNKKRLASRKQAASKKVEAMIDYLENNQICRTIQLLDYFGEESDSKCGVCDVCIQEKKQPQTDDIKERIIDLIKDKGPLLPEALRKLLVEEKKINALEQVSELVDAGILCYDEFGKLYYYN